MMSARRALKTALFDNEISQLIVAFRTSKSVRPTHFYKIVVVETGNGEFEAVAFSLANRAHSSPFDFEAFTESIDWIEARTGFDFMPNLDPDGERRLEREPGSLLD